MNGEQVGLPQLECPFCKRAIVHSVETRTRVLRPAAQYEDCLRQCHECGVGFSNTLGEPTLIHADPLRNIPDEVRSGALETLSLAINERNRKNKLKKFGFSTSEDAVTWTVFSFLARQRPTTLASLSSSVFGLPATGVASVLLWGVPITPGQRGSLVQEDVLSVSAALGERPRSRSEPDVVLDFGNAGVALVEVKYRSANDCRRLAPWNTYVGTSSAFSDARGAEASGLYELVRNWRIAHDLAGSRPFAVVNLAPERTLAKTRGLDQLVAGLNTSARARFLPLTWSSLLAAIETATGGLPHWLETYVKGRRLRS
jgi:hypothetical protein